MCMYIYIFQLGLQSPLQPQPPSVSRDAGLQQFLARIHDDVTNAETAGAAKFRAKSAMKRLSETLLKPLLFFVKPAIKGLDACGRSTHNAPI